MCGQDIEALSQNLPCSRKSRVQIGRRTVCTLTFPVSFARDTHTFHEAKTGLAFPNQSYLSGKSAAIAMCSLYCIYPHWTLSVTSASEWKRKM